MTKKLLTLFVFGLLSAPVYCMDRENDPYGNSGTSSMVPSSSSSSSASVVPDSGKTIKIQTSDGKEFDVLENIIYQSSVIKNQLEDFGDTAIGTIPLPEITAHDFKMMLSYLERLSGFKYKIEAEQEQIKDQLILDLQKNTVKNLKAIINGADYLDISVLLNSSIAAFAQKFLEPENIQQFITDSNYTTAIKNLLPHNINNLIAHQIIKQQGIPLPILKALLPTKPLQTLQRHSDSVSTLAFNPQGTVLATGSRDHTVCLYDMSDFNNPKLIKPLTDHSDSVSTLAFNRQGTVLATGSRDGTVYLYDISDSNNPKLITTLQDHSQSVTTLAFNPQGTLFATGSYDNTVCLYDMSDFNNPKLIKPLTDHSASVTALAFNPQGTLFATGSWDSTVCLYDMRDSNNPKLIKPLTDHSGWVSTLAFNRQGTMLAIGSWDSTVCLYDMRDSNNPKLITTLKDHSGLVTTLAFNPQGTMLATGSRDHTVCLYDMSDANNPNLIKKLHDHGNGVETLAFNPQGTLLATGSDDHTVCLYDISDSNNPKLITKLQNHSGLVTTLAFNPQGTVLAIGTVDKTVCLYDMNTHHEAMDFIKNKLTINQALFLFACDKNKLYLSGHPYLIEIFEQFPKSFQKALVDAGLVVLPSSWMAPGIIGGVVAAVAGYAFYSYLKK